MSQTKSMILVIATAWVLIGMGLTARGEILEFEATLDGICAQTGSAATGSGSFTLDTNTGLFSYNISISSIPSGEAFAHIHGNAPDPCSQPNQGFVAISLPLGSPKIGSQTIGALEQTDLINGEYYVNIHSNDFLDGEISGPIEQIFPPAPASSTWGLVIMVLLILAAGTVCLTMSCTPSPSSARI